MMRTCASRGTRRGAAPLCRSPIKMRQITTIATVGIMSGIMWAAEMWTRGWDGLNWTGRYHVSIVLSSILVVLILQSWSPLLRSKGKGYGVAIGILSSILAHLYFGIAGWFLFIIGPSAIPLHIFGDAGLYFGRFIGTTMFLMLPLFGYLTGILLKVEVHPRGILMGIAIMVLASMTLPIILRLISHPGSPDLIHTIKSGFAIPFLIFGYFASTITRKPANMCLQETLEDSRS